MPQLLDAPTTTATDKRADRRYQTTFGTVCRLDRGTKRPGHGLVWDISASGLGLLLSYAPDHGDMLPGELATEDGGNELPVLIQVAHVRPLSTGDYFVGGRFLRPLTAAEIAPFASPHPGRSHA